jgi:ubiquitin-conjugating enzyme E2 variant
MLLLVLSINADPTSLSKFNRRKLMMILDIIGAVLMADFFSGLFHWLEDAYGRENWPITGRLVTKPNILHHHEPRYFTRHSWFHSSWLLLCLGFVTLAIAWLCGVLTWRVWLMVLLGVNANQIHKWAHRNPAENGPLISLLQRAWLIQSPHHHGRHHTNPKNSRYCVITNFLNPIVDGMRLWSALEWVIWHLFGVRRRIDSSVPADQSHKRTFAQSRRPWL